MANPEIQHRGPEASSELEKAAGERSKELKETQAEKGLESSKENAEKALEAAKVEASKEAVSGREVSLGEKKVTAEEKPPVVTKKTREASYRHTMEQVQKELSPPARVFSQIIHNPAVEKVSDVVGNTVVRPNAILSGSLAAIILVGCLYGLARYMGFSLSGFETILAFAIGWILGVTFDIMRTAFKKR